MKLLKQIPKRTALNVGDFISVFRSVWGERDRELRLEWLRSNEHRFQPVLPFERALSEFAASPTKETLAKVTMPLLTVASFRNQMDALCSTDSSIRGPCSEMKMSYDRALVNLINKKLPSELFLEEGVKFSLDEHREIIRSTVTLLKDLEKGLREGEVPSPRWLEHYGLSGFAEAFEIGTARMKPESKWTEIRLGFVSARIEEAEKYLAEV